MPQLPGRKDEEESSKFLKGKSMAEFIGQRHIITELENLIPLIAQGKRMNFLLRGRSGMGKTTLSMLFAWKIYEKTGMRSAYYEPDDEGKIKFSPKNVIQVLDEVHKLKNPQPYYGLISSGNFIFILASNEYANLNEPLANRCLPLYFKEYSDEELSTIIRNVFIENQIPVNDKEMGLIIQSGNKVPRDIVNLSQRICFAKMTDKKLDVEYFLENVVGITDGLNPDQIRYVNLLRKLGKASLDTMAFSLSLDREIVQRQVEPTLLSRGIITITGRGRVIVDSLLG